MRNPNSPSEKNRLLLRIFVERKERRAEANVHLGVLTGAVFNDRLNAVCRIRVANVS